MNRIPDNWLEESLRYYGCLVCHALSRIEFDLLAELQGLGEGSALVEVKAGRRIGFCNLHFWRLYRMMSPRVAAPFLHKIFKRLIESNTMTFDEPCRVCMILNEVDKELLHQLIEQLENLKIREHYERTDGICLPHFHRLLTSDLVTVEMRNFLTSKQTENGERLLPLLQGLADKSYSLANDLERGSLTRGVEKLVGREGLG
ncbi:MAG: hypothetical protein ONB44_08525 [candidate division KSB1 bacterium]|nr:hypothetical protein [candidate division KSB1 bacterium]MDZ7302174.1 hypothetical protein [candidate division KSB1 bacterium]MDZ7311283.1 hypothetical protein [candidate division KSB1 bacterium]